MQCNKVHLIGRLCAKPEIEHTGGGTPVVNARFATEEQAGKERTLFIDIKIFGSAAEFVGNNLDKGALVYVEGRLSLDQWEKDGEKRSKLYVVAEKFQALEKKGK